ncbi:MAG TPA: D-aminoacylase [Blastocatellia bacterium]|nr:D-aminoacylase [Blastocatellia bacterium]
MAERILLRGGEVIDGSGSPAFKADLLIEGDRIADVGLNISNESSRAIDCSGKTITPGFIDMHSHSDLKLFVDPQIPQKIRQGVTTEVLGQDGISVAPVLSDRRLSRRAALAGLLGDPRIEWRWNSIGEYLSALDGKTATNVMTLIPHGAVRDCVIGPDDRPATESEVKEMVKLVEKSLVEGAAGISTGLIYPPCCYGTKEELIELCRPVAAAGRFFVVHMRSESDFIERGLEEVMDISRASGVHLHVSHVKIAGRNNWSKLNDIVAQMERFVDSGGKLSCDQYPYLAGSTLLSAVLPPWVHSGGVEKALERLSSKTLRQKMREEMLETGPCEWDNFYKFSGPEGIFITDAKLDEHRSCIGRNLSDLGAEYNAEPIEFAFDFLQKEKMAGSMVAFSQCEEVVQRFLRMPFTSICTDGLLGAKPHPRVYGAFPRVLGRYARELNTITFTDAVHRMTGLAASLLGLSDRGLVRAGMKADLVVLDPRTVIDKATYEEPAQFPVGIDSVFVNGHPAFENRTQSNSFSGRALRN